MKYAFGLLIVIISTHLFAGPIFPGRCIIYAPEFRPPNDTSKDAKFLKQQGIWGDIDHGFNSTGDRYYWSISTGGIIQFVEWQHSSIYLIGDYEMVGDEHSSIYFHPRGIFWTEGFLFADKLGETEFHTGYINRCHHDIDDLEAQPVGNGEERTLIYSSLLANAVWRDVNVAGLRSDLFTQLDWYVFKQDYLIPNPAIKSATNFERLIASISGGGKFDLGSIGDAKPYIRTSGTLTAFNQYKTFTFDARAEIGLQFQGEGAAMNVYVGGETLHDDGTRPIPVNSSFVYVGFRFLGRNIAL
jgi:hypothetical protein